jgi:uroporphyrinogen decarboxylase
MNKRQKFIDFLRNENDMEYIPFHPILMHFAARFNNYTYGEFASDYKVLVESNIRALEYFDLDWVGLISDPYRETSAFGADIRFIPEGVPQCMSPVITSPDDLKNLRKPDLYKSPRTSDRIKAAELYQKLLKGSVPVMGWIEGPLAEACSLAGVSNMLIYLFTDPDFSNRLLDKCLETAKEFAGIQIEKGCDIIGIGDAICSQIDRELYDLFVRDRHKELSDHIRSLGGIVKFHICGDITHLLPSLSRVQPDILDIDWQVSFEDAFGIMPPGTAVCGNINPVDIQDKSTGALLSLTKNLLLSNSGKKFILSGGCEITVNTPVQNLKTLRTVSKDKL